MRIYSLKYFLAAALILTYALSLTAQTKPARYEALRDRIPVPRQPYERYFTRDRFDREVTFYISETGNQPAPLPLVVFIQGSGCSSLFVRQKDAVVPSLGHITAAKVAEGKARILIVEKPGVTFLDTPPGCADSLEFNREHTLERWAEAVAAAIQAVQKLPQIERNETLVIGHSEGGLVACRVARELPRLVTHVASISGGGPSQLFDLLTLARRGNFFRHVSDDPEARVKYLLDQWAAIQSSPTSADKFFFGFAYRRWSTFLASSPLEELTRFDGKIYLAQGTEDEAVDPASSDILYAQLRARNKRVTYDRVEGADHSFNFKHDSKVNGWDALMRRIVTWFIQ